ncbi:class I SAM-dependent methyltransferase [Deltaproteobacteria bacterium TL4]
MSTMKRLVKSIYFSVLNLQNEEKNLLRFVSVLPFASQPSILEVGCGYGRNIKLLQHQGYKVLGVEINSNIVASNLKAHIPCVSVKDFEQNSQQYDLIIFSHIMEHLLPSDLWTWMDHYLDRLKSGGYLILSTPLLSPYFYDDFDHVKPYHPLGIEMVFGLSNAQIQYQPRNHLRLKDLWFRRVPFRLVFYAGIYLKKYSLPLLINWGFALLFRVSFGLIGFTDAWMGLYQKKET